MNQAPYNNQPPQYPNGYPPPNYGQFYYPPVPPPPPLARKYSTTILLILCIAYGLGWLFCFIGAAAAQGQASFLSNFGLSLFFGILASILMMDWQGGLSLQGLIQWQKRKTGRRILLGFLCFLVFPFLLAVYFFRTIRLYQHIPQAAPPRSRRPKIGLLVGGIVTLFALIFSSAGGATSAQQNIDASSITASPTATKAIVQIAQVTPTAVVHVTPTAIPTHVPPTAPPAVPTQAPVATPTPIVQPTQVPELSLTFTGASAVDYSAGSVSVHTQPGAALTIEVVYCTGHRAVSASLQGTSYADGGGNHTWTWPPETKCRGTATVTVTASWNGQSTTNSDDFTVQ